MPPRIHHVTSGGNVEVKKGQTVSLECRASGNPVPSVSWSRKVGLLTHFLWSHNLLVRDFVLFNPLIVEGVRRQVGLQKVRTPVKE